MDEIERAYIQHAQDVYKYLLSLTRNENLAEELTQETFFRAMRTMGNYDGSCKLSVWLCQIGRHLWYQWLHKHARQNLAALTDDIQGADSPEQYVLLHMEKTALYKAIHSLPESMREVVHMRLTGELSIAEIGGILGKSESWARVTFYRAKKKISEKMKAQDEMLLCKRPAA